MTLEPLSAEESAAVDRILNLEEGKEPEAPRGTTATGVSGTTGATSLLDWEYIEPGKPLVEETFLTPDGVTIIYGHGNIGKGWISLYFAAELTNPARDGGPMRVGILDYEGNRAEWMSRAMRLGIPESQLAFITYASPSEENWTASKGWIWEAAEAIAADFKHCDYLILDSMSAATPGGEAMGGKEDATRLFNTFRDFKKPALFIGHVGKQSEKFPMYPFGSSNLRNQAREQWAVAEAEQDFAIWAELPEDQRNDPKYFDYEPDVVSIEMKCTKRNAGQAPDNQFITFSFDALGQVGVFRPTPPANTLAEKAWEILGLHGEWMTKEMLAKAIGDKYDPVKPDSLKTVLNRNRSKFLSKAEGNRTLWGRVEWRNREEPK